MNGPDQRMPSQGRRSLVLGVGILSIALSLAGLGTYAVVQVPSLRSLYGEYKLENQYLNSLAYFTELILIVTLTVLGLLVNSLLVFGVHKNRRWYLVHWMIYHGLAMIGLFTTSILVFVIQTHLLKLIGLAPLAVVVLLALIWIQVYKLFEEMPPPSPKIDANLSQLFPHRPPPFMIEGAGTEALEADSVTSDYEFYPVDPISRGMFKKLNQNAWPQYQTQPPHISVSHPRMKDGDCDINLRTGRYFRFYDVRGLNQSDENLNREVTFGGNIDFKSSGSSLNI